jgi:hypothetical protein
MPHPSKGSRIAPLIERLLQETKIPDTDLGLNACQTANAACILAPGIEHLFVTLTAKYLIGQLLSENRLWKYQDLVYCPHTTIEQKCGFDLSIGHFERPYRIRTMHKLHYGKKRLHPWTDEDWSWSTADGDKKERKRIKRHLIQLFKAYNIPFEGVRVYEPFMVLHLCFCIHEYRRMGLEHNGVKIPGFEDKLRTVVLDLRPIGDLPIYQKLVEGSHFNITVKHRATDDSITAELCGIKSLETLEVWELGRLRNHVDGRVSVTFDALHQPRT